MPAGAKRTVPTGTTTVVTTSVVALATMIVAGCTTGSPAAPDLSDTGLGAARTAQAGGLSVAFPDGADRHWSRAALHDLARTSVRAADGSTVTEVALTTLTSYAGPPFTPPEVATVRTSYVVSGDKGRVRIARAETEAGIGMRASTLVTVVSSSGSSASVTLGEQMSARKRMGFSFSQDGRALPQPTFIVDGDASGARTVADVTQLVITSA